jgi:hypothetical protein
MCDIVRMIMEVEQRFDVTIPDEQAERMVTVGDLYLYLLRKTRRTTQTPCPTSQAFYRLRRTLMAEFSVDRGQVRPATRLCKLFPAANRRATWPRLAAALGLPHLSDLPTRYVPSARAFGICFALVTAAWWLLGSIPLLVSGDTFAIAYGLIIWFLLALLVWQWYGILWVAGALNYLVRIRIPNVRHLVIRLLLQQPDQSSGGVGQSLHRKQYGRTW